MKRVCLIVLDAVGAGALPDADKYGDVGANTLGNVVKYGQPKLPTMAAMGLGKIPTIDYPFQGEIVGGYGRANEVSPGKDTTTGHWEIAGLTLEQAFPTFHEGFPQEVISSFEQAIGRKTLGNYAASGTEIIKELGKEHLETGFPIVYTSADSVFQIACHEQVYSTKELYHICEIAREKILTGPYAVGRVIARPFAGEVGSFYRTADRKDFSIKPFQKTILDLLKENGFESIGVGKIEDIFAMQGITQSTHSAGNEACINTTIDYLKQDFTGLLFVNLVDTDMNYGHRRDVKGFAGALTYFDKRLTEIKALMTKEDLLIITADHGCDPTFKGTDHTREYVPILAWSPKMDSQVDLGTRKTFSDIAATIAEGFQLSERFNATSFYQEIMGENRKDETIL
ncbi:MAG: phosphopentomutase [Clostridiales bacterium]|nr:phosphopentomutase [Clostridiales bacterium]